MKSWSNEKKKLLLTAATLTLLLVSLFFPGKDLGLPFLKAQNVQAATKTATVRFKSNNGKETYKMLQVKVAVGKKIVLPELPDVLGYENLGWSTKKKATKATYAAGKKLTVSKNLNLYSVRKRVGTVSANFYTNAGKAESDFTKLNTVLTKGTYVTLPEPPAQSGYKAVGWATTKGAATATKKVGQKVRLTKSTKFYAVYNQVSTVTLCKNDGTAYKKVQVVTGKTYKLPSVRNASGYTFMGWDTIKRKQTSPKYEAGQTITVKKDIKLYAVVFNRAREEDITTEALLDCDRWRWGNGTTNRGYNRVIFVGDSRTAYMENTLRRQFGGDSNVLWGIDFVCMPGMGLTWLKSDGAELLLDKIQENYSVYKPTAVIFNLGVNDLTSSASYISYLMELSETLKAKNCKLFFMSVNPVSSATRAYIGEKARKEESVRSFNATVCAGLADTYSYIDTYSYLMETGFGFDSGEFGIDTGKDDGLHYTTKTYKRIFRYCLDYLVQH